MTLRVADASRFALTCIEKLRYIKLQGNYIPI